MSQPQPTPPTRVAHHDVVAGIIASASRFVPIPFVDDVIKAQCRRFVIAQVLAEHQRGAGASTRGGRRRSTSLEDLKPVYSSDRGCVGGCLSLVAKAPLKLLLFPIRKVVALVTSVRGVPLEILRTVLLARTVRRRLAVTDMSAEDSRRVRRAFDEAFARMDFHAARAAIADVMRHVSGWKSAAVKDAEDLSQSRSPDPNSLSISPDVEQSANEVQRALDQPAIASLFEQFDQRFDAALDEIINEANA